MGVVQGQVWRQEDGLSTASTASSPSFPNAAFGCASSRQTPGVPVGSRPYTGYAMQVEQWICQTVSATCLIIKNWDICCQTIYTHGVPILSVPSTKRAIMPGYHLSEETLRLPEEQNCPQHQRRKTRRLGGGEVRGGMTWWSKWKPGSP